MGTADLHVAGMSWHSMCKERGPVASLFAADGGGFGEVSDFMVLIHLGDILMSDAVSTVARAVPEEGQLFSNAELREFEADDVEAGRRIAKILTAFFVYTLLAMCVSIAWSFAAISR